MHERNLGDTDLRLTEVTLGTWGLSGAYGPVTESLVRDTLDAAIEAGVKSVDVAPLWGDMEARVGEAIADHEAIKVITRGGAVLEDGQVQHRFDPESLRADLERSRERLGREVLDVWLLHDPSEGALAEDDPFATAATLVEEGHVRCWGVSTTQHEVAARALEAGAKAICVPHHMFASDLVGDLRQSLEASGAGVLARSPLAHGLLSGRWTEYRRFAADDHRHDRWTAQALAIRVRQVAQVRFLVKNEVRSLTAAALRFALDSPAVATAVVGARRPAQIRDLDQLVGDAPYLEEPDRVRLQQVLAAAGV